MTSCPTDSTGWVLQTLGGGRYVTLRNAWRLPADLWTLQDQRLTGVLGDRLEADLYSRLPIGRRPKQYRHEADADLSRTSSFTAVSESGSDTDTKSNTPTKARNLYPPSPRTSDATQANGTSAANPDTPPKYALPKALCSTFRKAGYLALALHAIECKSWPLPD